MSFSGYFDYNATTPVCAEALDAFMEAATAFANPSSSYALSSTSKHLMREARENVAALIGARADEVSFTSGGTEANNWAIKGAFFQRLGWRRERPHLIVSAIEHASVLETCAFLERTFGCEVTRLTPDAEGLVSAAAVARALRPSTVVVTVMMVNNEVGTLQPVREIAALLQGHDAHFHVDAVQAVGKMPVNAHELGVHSLSFSGHKFHAPKGIGGLYLRSDVEITPLLHGGGQENGLRGGTEAVAMAAAMGAAARSAHAGMAEQVAHAVLLARTLRSRLYDTVPGIHFHGPEDEARRIANTLSLCVRGIRAEALAALLDHRHGIQVSLGSACSNNKSVALSHVLKAMGLGEEIIKSTLRISIGRYTTLDDVERFVQALAAAASMLARIATPASPQHVPAA